MKVSVDTDLCASTGGCVQTCPDVFELDRFGYVVVREADPDPSLHADVREAADLCPTAAIELTES